MTAREGEQIGRWRFDTAGARLVGEAEERKLEDRAARTLAILCRRRGEVVSREEILAEVWNGRAVSANSVAVVVRDLRRALDDDAKDPRHIETIAKRGYRLAPAAVGAPESAPAERRSKTSLALLAVVSAAIVIALAAWLASAMNQPRLLMVVEPVRNETGLVGYAPLSKALSQVVTNRASKFDDATIIAPGGDVEARAHRHLKLSGRLILWNGVPALMLTATDINNGRIAWTGIAEGQPDVIAQLTADRLSELDRRITSLPR